MELVLPFFVFVVLLIIGAIVLALSWTFPSGKKRQENPINGTNFIPSQIYIAQDGCSGIAVNEQTFRICLLKNPAVTPHVLPISCLIGSFLVNNGGILGERLRTIPKELIHFQQLVSARLEELKQNHQTNSSQEDNQHIDLIVLIHDEMHPLHEINFLDMETKEGGILYENALATAAHWHKILADLIYQADQQAQFRPDADRHLPDWLSPPAAELLEKPGDTEAKCNILLQNAGISGETSSAAKS